MKIIITTKFKKPEFEEQTPIECDECIINKSSVKCMAYGERIYEAAFEIVTAIQLNQNN